MANQILPKLQTSPGEPPPNDPGPDPDREGFFSESLSLIRKVIAGRRTVRSDDVPDLSQDIALRLWKWYSKFEEKSSQMEEDQWKSFTARTAHNEVNRNLSNRSKHPEVPLDEIQAGNVSTDAAAEGTILVEIVWQGICKLSLYQRQALLFNSIDLVLYLLQLGVEERELLEALALTSETWEAVAERMPLSDTEIAEMASLNEGRTQLVVSPGAVKKARCDARKRLKELMNK